MEVEWRRPRVEQRSQPTKLTHHPKQQQGVLKRAIRPTARQAAIGKNSISPKVKSISAYFW